MTAREDDWEKRIDDGWAQLGRKDREGARATFAALLAECRAAADRSEDRRFQIVLGLGSALSRLGRHAEAEELLLEALRLAPANGRVAELIGENAMGWGHAESDPGLAMQRFQRASNHFARAAAMGHQSDALDYNIACMESRLGRHDEVVIALRRAIEADPTVRDAALDDPDLAGSLDVPEVRRLLSR